MSTLAAYADMLADPDVPSAKIAELADVDVAEVERFRAGAPAPAAGDPEPEPEEPAPKPARASKGAKPPKAAPAPAAAPAAAPAPTSVRATLKRRIKGPTGRSLLVKRFDVFNGELAAWMWAHHRDLVQPLEA